MLPFTADQFFDVFVRYNLAIWPAQIAAYALGVLALWLVYRRQSRWVTVILAAMWAWTGLAYHVMQFSSINGVAYIFGAFFVLEAVGLLYFGLLRDQLRFGWHGDVHSYVGILFVGYALVAYPLIGLSLGQSWIELPAFGLTPCPVTIFTFGVLLITTTRAPTSLQLIPFLWTLIGGSAAFLLNVPQDVVLLISGVVAGGLLLVRARPARIAHA